MSVKHSNIWGPGRISTSNGYKSFITFMNELSRCSWIDLMKEHSSYSYYSRSRASASAVLSGCAQLQQHLAT